MKLTLNFKELGRNDAMIAGGKGASLGEMTQAGIPVPPGFVVLSTTFDEFIKEADLIQEIDSIIDSVNHKEIHTVDAASEKIQALIRNAVLPEKIALEIKAKFKDLDTEFVAVRSSATAEDGADNAWAGQLDSFLNTKEANLLEKVQHCWASLFTPRAIFYRFEKGLHTTKISVAVVVQKMVNSEVSGIAFSVHPVTEDRNQLIIEAGFGMGEAIVSGQVTPDSYVVEKEPRRIIDISVSAQTRALYRVQSGGNQWIEVPEPKASSQVLSETQILEFADLIMKIENHYGFPCDIEWAFEKGKFYIVQSRPITTLMKKQNNIINPDIETTITRDNSLIDMVAWHKGYTEEMYNWFGWSYSDNLYYIHDGYAEIMRSPKEHFVDLKNHIIKKIDAEPTWFENQLKRYGELVEEIYKFYDTSKKSLDNCSASEVADIYRRYFKYISTAIGPFVAFGWFPILLEGDIANTEKYKKEIDLAKLYRKKTENLLPYGAELTNLIIQRVSIETKIDDSLLKVMLPDELLSYLKDKHLPNINELKARREGSIYSKKGLFFTDNSTENIKTTIDRIGYNLVIKKTADATELKGQVACEGKVIGPVKVVTNKKDISTVKEGEILVAPMTTPEYLPAMKKAAAYITDEGGITSHAAIVARELKKPCIIGTKNATKIFKDGDIVEVDADKGVVRILESGEKKQRTDKSESIDCKVSDNLTKKINEIKWVKILQRKRTPYFNSLIFYGAINKNNKKITLDFAGENWAFVNGAIFVSLKDISKISQLMQNLFEKDNSYFLKFINEAHKNIAEFNNFVEEYLNRDYRNISNLQLKNYFIDYNKKFIEICPYMTVAIFADKLLEKEISVICADKPDQTHYFELFTSPARLGYFEQQNIDFAQLILKLKAKKQSVIDDVLVDEYLDKYSWLENMEYNGDFLKREELITRIKKGLESSIDDLEKDPNNCDRTKELEIAFNKLKLNSREIDIIKTGREFVHFRAYRTDVFFRSAYFVRPLFEEISKRLNISYKDIFWFLPDEIEILLEGGQANPELVEKRKDYYSILVMNGNLSLNYSKDITEDCFCKEEKFNGDSISGQSAFKGNVRGRVRIILSKKDIDKFLDGEILVSTMTKPDLLPIMEKASAFITDEGGITCHAAIVARELKKPCIIGTKNATKILKDGDMVEVDADNGVVRIIK